MDALVPSLGDGINPAEAKGLLQGMRVGHRTLQPAALVGEGKTKLPLSMIRGELLTIVAILHVLSSPIGFPLSLQPFFASSAPARRMTRPRRCSRRRRRRRRRR